MPTQDITLSIDGRVNRRDPSDKLGEGEVLSRENFIVIGVGNNKQNKKMPGSKRLTSTATGTRYTWLFNYYSGNTSKMFGYNNGTIYHIAEDGTVSGDVGSLNPNAYPTSTIMKISDNNIVYFSDGFNGMYSYDGNGGNNWKKENPVTLNFVYMISHLDRIFAFEEDSEDLYFSKTLEPNNYTDTTDAGLITIGAKRGAKIQALAILNETLYIFKEDSMFVLEGRTPNEFRVREVHPVLGVAARHSLVNTKSGSIIFLGSDYEFHSFSGTQGSTQQISYNMAVGGDFTKDLNPLINKNRLNQVYAVFHNDLYRCSFVKHGEVDNNYEYIFNTTNLTDCLTVGNKVSCYMVRGKQPNINELYTGRYDSGLIMIQYYGLNYDDGQSGANMSYKLQSRFIRSENRISRFRRFWPNFNVLGRENIQVKVQLATRLATSDKSTIDMVKSGETKSITNFVTVQNQGAVTSRGVIPWSNGRGQSISLGFDGVGKDIDLSISDFSIETVVKSKKRNEKVGV